MTETYVKFRGTNASVDNLSVGLGDHVEFSGYGKCVAVGTEERADGEQRPIVTVKVEEVDLGDITKPKKEDQLPFDEADEDLADDDADDDADDEDEADA